MSFLFWFLVITAVLVFVSAAVGAAIRFASINKDYKMFMILGDLKSGKIKDADVDEALRVSKIIEDIKKFKPNIKDLLWLNEERLRRAANFQNTYTRGEPIPVDFYLDKLHLAVGALPAKQQTALNAVSTIGNLLRKISDSKR
jgi:hypothetical protein